MFTEWMNGYSIWYWPLDKLGFGFFQQSFFFGRGEKTESVKCSSVTHPSPWGQCPDRDSESWSIHTSLLHSLHRSLALLPSWGQHNHMRLMWKSFFFWILWKGPRELTKLWDHHHYLWMFQMRTLGSRGLWLPKATQVESWGKKVSLLPFSHTTLSNQSCGLMRGPPWKGLGLSASSLVEEIRHAPVDGWWAIALYREVFGKVLWVLLSPVLPVSGPAVCNKGSVSTLPQES